MPGLEARWFFASTHLALGLGWLAVTACFALQLPWAWSGMLVCAVLGLWYLPFGTLLSVLQIALLSTPALRGPGPPRPRLGVR